MIGVPTCVCGCCYLHYRLLNLTISPYVSFSVTDWQVVVTVALWARGFFFLWWWVTEKHACFHLLLPLGPGLNTFCPRLNTHWRKRPTMTTGHRTHFTPERDLWWPFWSFWPWLSCCCFYCSIIIALWSGACVKRRSLLPQYFKTLHQSWKSRTEKLHVFLFLF